MQKKQTNKICYLCPFLEALKLFGKILKNHQILSRCSAPCIFSTEKEADVVPFISALKITRKCKITSGAKFRPEKTSFSQYLMQFI